MNGEENNKLRGHSRHSTEHVKGLPQPSSTVPHQSATHQVFQKKNKHILKDHWLHLALFLYGSIILRWLQALIMAVVTIIKTVNFIIMIIF